MDFVTKEDTSPRRPERAQPQVEEQWTETLSRPPLFNRYDADSSPAPLAHVANGAVSHDLNSVLSPDLETQPELAATIYNAAGIAYLNRGHVALARKYVEMSLEIRREFYGEEHPAVAESLQSRARLLRHDGNLKGAEADIRRALGIHRAVNGGTGLAMAATLWELSVIQLENAELAGAKRSALEGIGIIEKLYLDRSDPHMPRLMDVVARVHLAHGEYAEAAETYAKVLSDVAEKQGDRHPKYATYLANLGTVEEARDNLAEAEECYRKAIDIYENVNGKHPNLSAMYVNMAAIQQAKGPQHFESARLLYGKALALSRDIYGPDHQFFAYDESSLARLERESNNFEEARRLGEDALRIYRATQPVSAYTASTLTLLARIVIEGTHRNLRAMSYDNELRRAKEQLAEALAIFRKEYGERSLHFAFAQALLGRAMFLGGEAKTDVSALLASTHALLQQLAGPAHETTKLAALWIDELEQSDPKIAAI